MVNNKLKDHMGIAPDPSQYADSWYTTQINCTLESHTTLYQYIINHQLQANSIANHMGTVSTTIISYESYVETVHTFAQTIDHAHHKAATEKLCHKPLQAKSNGGQGG